jgi:hypothetical protein
VAHLAIRQLLLELVSCILNALARRLDVVDRDAEMAKAARVRVAVRDLIVGVVLGAVVVRELDDTLAVGPVVAVRDGFGAVVCEEVEVELCVWVLDLVDELEAEEFVELD